MSQSAVGYDNAHITTLPTAWAAGPKVTSPAPEWRPEMVTTPLSAEELAEQARDAEARRLASLRPADKSVEAVQAALENIVRERAIADHRLSARRDAVARLLDGTYHPPADIKAANDALDLAEIEAEQFGRMEDGMRVSLTRAQDEEAAERKAKVAQLAAAEATVDAWRKFVAKRYPALAAELAAGLALERQAEQAIHLVRWGANNVPGKKSPEDLPRVRNGLQQEAYRVRACLPGTDVTPTTI
jgi:hypothetical protein